MKSKGSKTPAKHYVFVDFESVSRIDPAILGEENFHLVLLLGPQNRKLDVSLWDHRDKTSLKKLSSPGRNALDFALAYYLGQEVQRDPLSCFHIISKDKGFDPLVEHLRENKIKISRHDEFSLATLATNQKAPPRRSSGKPKTGPTSKPAAARIEAKSLVERARTYIGRPTPMPPRTKQKLQSHLRTHFGKGATELEVTGVIEEMRKAGDLEIDGRDRVTYHFR